MKAFMAFLLEHGERLRLASERLRILLHIE